MSTKRNPALAYQSRVPVCLASLALGAVGYVAGWWALAAAPVLLAALVYNAHLFAKRYGPPYDKSCHRLPWYRAAAWGICFALQPGRYAMCRCCGGIKDLREIRRDEQKRAAEYRAAMLAHNQRAAGGF